MTTTAKRRSHAIMEDEDRTAAMTLNDSTTPSDAAADIDPDDDDPDNSDPISNPVGSNVRVVVRVRPLLSSELPSHKSTYLHVNERRVDVRGEKQQQQEEDEKDGDVQSKTTSNKDVFTPGQISLHLANNDNSESTSSSSSHTYSFDSILSPYHTQTDVYEAGRVDRMLKAVMKGYNALV